MVLIEAEAPEVCSRCGENKELREVIIGQRMCFQCATPSEREAYGRRLFGEDTN